MHQRTESIQARKQIPSLDTQLSIQRRRRKGSLRRTWIHGLPSLATNTVKMFVATLQINNQMAHEAPLENYHRINEFEQNSLDNDDDDIYNIGQEVQAHIPDIVLNNLNDLIDRKGNIRIPNEHTYDNSTLLFLDVSGFTSLTEQYSNDAHLGIDQLTRTLNSYFDKLVYEILTHDGDIYKFAGDAILALWTNERTGPQQALKCAIHLQQTCGAYETDVGVILRVKVALAYGPVRALFVGTEDFKHYLLTGDCIKNVNVCEQLCEPGDVIITKSVYDKIDSTYFNCDFVPVSEEIDPKQEHIAVKYSQSRRSTIDEPSGTEEHNNTATVIQERMDSVNQEITNDAMSDQSSENDLSDQELYSRVNTLMKSFILHCVYQRIERKQSLDYLSELRRVTISFINLDISNEQTVLDNIHENIHKVFVQIYELTTMMGGVLTKALLFDKGWSFLCVFGLPGYKQGDDTANALKSAQMIHSQIREQCQFVEKCSIGVTTGLTYCGVVGHRARCEYTVIGRKVNMAARLMCNYPNVVSCDQETYYNSRLQSRFFRILPDKSLKGMNNVGAIWHYNDSHALPQANEQTKSINHQINDARHEDLPLLGRRVELMIVATQIMLLNDSGNTKSRRRELAAIIFEGEDKIGRTRLLQFIADSLENSSNVTDTSLSSFYNNTYIPNDSTINNNAHRITNQHYDNQNGTVSSLKQYSSDCSVTKHPSIHVINCRCQFEQRFNEFSLLRSLLNQLLQFHSSEKTQHDREQHLLRLFDINKSHDLHLRRNLFLLNDLFDVRFHHNLIEVEDVQDTNFVKCYEANINELLLHILNKLIDQPSAISDLYSANSTINSMNSRPLYLKSRASSSSIASLTSSITIPTFSKIIFIIDDIHFADESSLKHLLTLGSHRKSLLILSMKPPRNNNNDRTNCNILQSITTDSRVYLRRLPGLELRHLATLGCQILSVHRLPEKLVRVFNESCNGIPGFCEQILYDFLGKDKIYITENTNVKDQGIDLVEGDADRLCVNHSQRHSLVKFIFSPRIGIVTPERRKAEPIFSRVCLLRNLTDEDFNADCQQNFQNYIMCRIDRLSEGEILLVKTAAVIGNTFSRTFLWHLVDPPSKALININSCILEMMQRNVIECAHCTEQSVKTRSIKCYCLQNPGNFPSQCRLMAFTHSTVREGIYNSLTDTLKRTLTRNAIDYLEKQATIVCSACGRSKNESPFLVYEHIGLAKFIKNRQQPAFADIVKLAALKEIDDIIKQISKQIESSERAQSGRPMESMSVPNANSSVNNEKTKRWFSIDVNNIQSVPLKSPVVLESVKIDEDFPNEVIDTQVFEPSDEQQNSNLTLISLYSPDAPSNIQFKVKRTTSTTSSQASQLFSLFKLPNRHSTDETKSTPEVFKTVQGSLKNDRTNKTDGIVEASKQKRSDRSNRFITFIRYLFCQFTPISSNVTVTPSIDDQAMDHNNDLSAAKSDEVHSQENENRSDDYFSYWKKVRKAILPSINKIHRPLPSEDELLEQPMFSSDLIDKINTNLSRLHTEEHLTRSFEILYDQSLSFYTFQSFTQYNKLLQHVYETKPQIEEEQDLNDSLSESTVHNDLRICECIDYVMTVYLKLVEYHTNLYDIYHKASDDKRDCSHWKQFDRIMYYRIEICRLLLNCNYLQRLMVEVENGRRFLEKFQSDTQNSADFMYEYHSIIVKHTFNLFEAIVLQRTKIVNDSKQICDDNLKELNQAYEDKSWEKLISNNQQEESSSATEKRHKYEHSKDSHSKQSLDINQSTTINSDQFILFKGKYHLEYLLCQYNLLKYELSHRRSTESIHTLLKIQYHIFPLSFSLSCTIILVEYFYSQNDYQQCLTLIDRIIQFWWPFITPQEKLEFGKLKSLKLIVELKHGSIDSAISSGYFAKRLLTNYHENTFLFETCTYLTLASIGEMRMSNIDLILQHLEYLSEQTMNCYGKLWYYTLVIDAAMELGYEIIPITAEILQNITIYRRKLFPGPNGRNLLLFYCDCVLAQVYARLGLLNPSKIHFHQALFQIEYDHMNLSSTDFRFQRALLKLIEVQLIHWYYTKDTDENLTKDNFILNYINESNNEAFLSWNKTRYLIYQAYYDRLINDYRRQNKLSIDNDLHWEESLREAEKTAIKIDTHWIECLRHAWSHSVSEQIPMKLKQVSSIKSLRRPTAVGTKQSTRRVVRPTLVLNRISSNNEINGDNITDEQSTTVDSYSHQTFLNWRSFSNNTTNKNSPYFQLYILPVKV
ncbi:unnamed protein product [Adineta ricciae]|uniref:Guanylate cyclase domain-containing protein n=1 Tax=Adineta ricciae TaxID=249248 RepID=A0A815CN19_ADIRI|nr:unnamed protein product [Adineta ricciae]CAF1285052.1 unnamed protein product [Adineta ricciae]